MSGELRLWCQSCWEKYGPLGNPETNGIMLTVTLTQEFLRLVSEAHPGVKDIASVAYVEGPGCCFIGPDRMQVMSRAVCVDMLELSTGKFGDKENGPKFLMEHLVKVGELMGVKYELH